MTNTPRESVEVTITLSHDDDDTTLAQLDALKNDIGSFFMNAPECVRSLYAGVDVKFVVK